MDRCVILHIEDDDSAAFLFRSALDDTGIAASVYRVSTAEQGLQFLRKTGAFDRAKQPQLIMLDLRLPKRDGWSFLAEMQREPLLQKIPVVVLSVEPATQFEAKALAAGALQFIEKPYQYDLLVQQVKRAYLLSIDNNPAEEELIK